SITGRVVDGRLERAVAVAEENRNGVVVAVRHGDVGLPVAIEVGDGQRYRRAARGENVFRSERPVGLAEKDGDRRLRDIDDGDVDLAVAVDVGGGNRARRVAGGEIVAAEYVLGGDRQADGKQDAGGNEQSEHYVHTNYVRPPNAAMVGASEGFESCWAHQPPSRDVSLFHPRQKASGAKHAV